MRWPTPRSTLAWCVCVCVAQVCMSSAFSELLDEGAAALVAAHRGCVGEGAGPQALGGLEAFMRALFHIGLKCTLHKISTQRCKALQAWLEVTEPLLTAPAMVRPPTSPHTHPVFTDLWVHHKEWPGLYTCVYLTPVCVLACVGQASVCERFVGVVCELCTEYDIWNG